MPRRRSPNERRSPRRPEVEQLVAAYRADLLAAGMFAEHPVTSPARTFLTRVGIAGWQRCRRPSSAPPR